VPDGVDEWNPALMAGDITSTTSDLPNREPNNGSSENPLKKSRQAERFVNESG